MKTKTFVALILLLNLVISCDSSELRDTNPTSSGTTKTDLMIGLVAYYPFNNNTLDDSGYGNHGTISGTVTPTADRFGNSNSSYEFPAGVNNKIIIPNNSNFTFVNSFSVSMWVKFNQVFNYRSESLIYKGAYPLTSGWSLDVNQDDSLLGAGNFAIQGSASFNGNANGAKYKQTFTEINKWRHICYTYNNYKVSIYVDGILRESIPLAGATVNNLSNIIIGGNINPTTTTTFSKNIDEVKIWNRALSDKEISFLYTSN